MSSREDRCGSGTLWGRAAPIAPQKSYSSSETLKAYDQDARLTYGSRVKDLVPQEAEEFCRTGEGGRVGG